MTCADRTGTSRGGADERVDLRSASAGSACGFAQMLWDRERRTTLPVEARQRGIVSEIAGGDNHSCALVNGGVKCWGYNPGGQVGDGSTTTRASPVDVVGLTTGVQAISLGWARSCALTSGQVKCKAPTESNRSES